MAAEDMGSGDLAVIINGEMMILKGAVKVLGSIGKKLSASKLNPFVLMQTIMKLRKMNRISQSDYDNFKTFMKDCEGNYTIANLPTQDSEKLEKLKKSLREVGVTFYELPDLEINDGMRQIAIRGQDVGKWQSIYETFVTGELSMGGKLTFQELKSLTAGQYQIKGVSLGDGMENNDLLKSFCDILDEHHVNYALLPDLKHGDFQTQLAIANVDLKKFREAVQIYTSENHLSSDGFVQDMSMDDYTETGNMTEKDYINTSDEKLKKDLESKTWDQSDTKTEVFDDALAGKEKEIYNKMKSRPGQQEIWINEKMLTARDNDKIFFRIPHTDKYIMLEQTLSADEGKTFVAFLQLNQEYQVFQKTDDNSFLPSEKMEGSAIGKFFSKEERNLGDFLDHIPAESPYYSLNETKTVNGINTKESIKSPEKGANTRPEEYVQGYQKPEEAKGHTQNTFNNFQQRKYDMDKLEAALLKAQQENVSGKKTADKKNIPVNPKKTVGKKVPGGNLKL